MSVEFELEPQSPPSERVPLAVTLCALVVVAGYLATEMSLLSFRLGFPLDDSWIHLQFARNLAAGAGLSYNLGELVTGSTSPLWTCLLSLFFHLPGNIVVWTKLVGGLAFVLAMRATYRLGAACGLDRSLAALAALLAAGTYWLVWSALSGMEICLFLWLSLEGMVLQARELGVQARTGRAARLSLALPVLGLAALARPEGLLLLTLAGCERLISLAQAPTAGERRSAWRSLVLGAAGAAVIVLPTLAFYTWVGGSPLPTTFGAKAGEARGLLPDGQYLFMVFGILFRPQPWMALLAGGGAVLLFARRAGDRGTSVLLGLWALGLPLVYSLLAPQGKHLLLGNFGRYFFPLFPSVVVLGCLLLGGPGAALGNGTRRRAWVRILGVVVLALPTLYTLVQGAGFYAQNVANVEDGDVRMGLWLAGHVPPQAVLAVQDIGAIKFFAPQRILDLAGIVSPEIQHTIRDAVSPADRFGQAGMLRFLAERRPDFLVAFPSWYPGLVASGTGFEPVYTLAVPDNITLAGDQLVVYKTPWTRYPLVGDSTR